MIEIGHYNTLRVHRIQSDRVLLGEDGDYVPLPAREVEGELQVGQSLKVFVYTDDGPVATTREPKVMVGGFAFLEVVDVNRHGAFLDWGLPKDLFVPFGNQYEPMRAGRSYVVGVRLHRRTQRIVGASLLAGMFDDDVAHLSPGDAVDLLVYGQNDRGVQVIVDHAHAGLVYHDQVYQRLRPGQELKGWVSLVRPDHRLDITLQRTGPRAIDDARAAVLEALEASGGELSLHDKSPPAEIQRRLGMSKKVFKKAVGQLYKDHIIELVEGGIRRAR